MNKIAICTLLLISLISCQNNNTKSSKLEVIRIAYQDTDLPGLVAVDKGWFDDEFKKDGIKIEYKRFIYGPPIIEAILGGNIDIGYLGDQPAIVGWAKDVPIKAVAAYGQGYHSLGLVATDSTIKSIKDLKGKKIAVSLGSLLQHLLYLYLEQANMKPSDIEMVNLKESSTQIAALESHNIDGAVLINPYLSLVEYKKLGKIVSYSDGLKYSTLPILASTPFIEHYPEIVKRILRVYAKALTWSKKNPNECAAVFKRLTKDGFPDEIIVNHINNLSPSIVIDSLAIDAFQSTYNFLEHENLVPKGKSISDFYVLNLIQ